jgi:hypothetical protein
MKDPLATYLHDHLAGSHFAIQLLDSLHEQYREEDLGDFAFAMREEVKQDQGTLQTIIDRVGTTHLDLTEAAGWLAEKASQFKLQRDDSRAGLGTFEALETLTLGIRGKWALWKVLPSIREADPRIPNLDFDELRKRADDQFTRVEDERLKLAEFTFWPAAKG